MTSFLKNALGIINVTQSDTEIEIGGIASQTLVRDITRFWGSSKIAANMFSKISSKSFRIPLFFAPDLHYVLQQLLTDRYSWTRKSAIRSAIQELEQNTWLTRLQQEPEKIFDRSRLSLFKKTPLPHQVDFFNLYEDRVPRYGLNGFLLSAAAGSGKTLMDLMIAEMLHADTIVIVSPKNAIDRVWVKTVQDEYHKPQSLWVYGRSAAYKNERIILTHYEGLEKAGAEIRRAATGKVVFILDESHNFNEITAARTDIFCKLVQEVKPIATVWASGTPIKALGYEAIPLLRTIDPLFTRDVEERYKKVFGRNAKRALDILRNRIGLISFRVEKTEVVDNKATSRNIEIEIPNGREYTLDSVRAKMAAFIQERGEYYKKEGPNLIKRYHEVVAWFERTLDSREERAALAKYKDFAKMISHGFDPELHKQEAIYCNHYEKNVIMPVLDNQTRKEFRSDKSVYKYVHLKIQGEALGGVLGKLRTQCHVDMIPHLNIQELISEAEKKTVMFTSYVEVVTAVDEKARKENLKAALVYGDTNKNLAGIIGAFEKDPRINPLVATFMSLSTAVPLVMADQAIFLNAPFRDHEMTQAKARIDRLGQDTPVKFVHLYLRTGKDPNVSTRSKDIMEWSKEQIAAIMGQSYTGDELVAATESFCTMRFAYCESSRIVLESVFDEVFDAEKIL